MNKGHVGGDIPKEMFSVTWQELWFWRVSIILFWAYRIYYLTK